MTDQTKMLTGKDGFQAERAHYGCGAAMPLPRLF